MQRYFTQNINGRIVFSEQDVFHITKVMRNKIGDEIEIVFENKAYLSKITALSPFVEVKIIEPLLKDSELKSNLTIFFPLTRSEKMELVIQKATEVGATNIVLYRAKRSIVKIDDNAFNKKKLRFEMIAKEAAEQCHRLKVPNIIGILNLNEIKTNMSDINLLAYELIAGNTSSLFDEINDTNKSYSLIVGPEGGFEKEEVDALTNDGFKCISLGKRILRCETAAIYGLSVISAILDK